MGCKNSTDKIIDSKKVKSFTLIKANSFADNKVKPSSPKKKKEVSFAQSEIKTTPCETEIKMEPEIITTSREPKS